MGRGGLVEIVGDLVGDLAIGVGSVDQGSKPSAQLPPE
jgi:hypothetical protein